MKGYLNNKGFIIPEKFGGYSKPPVYHDKQAILFFLGMRGWILYHKRPYLFELDPQWSNIFLGFIDRYKEIDFVMDFYDATDSLTWRAHNGEFIYVHTMNQDDLFQAAFTIEQFNLRHLRVYKSIINAMNNQSDFILSGKL